MDKLEPVLAQKFWIVTAIALILPSYGWWKAATVIQEDTDDRTRVVNASFESLPPDNEVPAIPNEDWTKSVAQENRVRDLQNREATNYLWESQQQLMFWPDDVADPIKSAGYRGKLEKSIFRTFYAEGYEKQIATLRRIVNPFQHGTGNGIVELQPESLTRVPADRWGPTKLPPTVREIWDAQEDIWLQTALYSGIAEVNRNATSIIDAPIKIINKLQLMGGSRQSANAGPAGPSEAESRRPTGRRESSRAIPARTNMQRGNVMVSVDFPPENEFGTPAKGAAFEGGRTRRPGSRRSGDGDDDDEDEDESGPTIVRYIDDGPNVPYKTRGFYLKVVMDERFIPELLAEFTSLAWPVEILRVHRVSLMESDLGERLRSTAARASAQETSERAKNVLATALNEPFLSTVVVAGLMTIYTPVKQPAAQAQGKPGAAKPPANANARQASESAAPDAEQEPAQTEDGEPAESEPGTDSEAADPADSPGDAEMSSEDAAESDESTSDDAPDADALENPAADSSSGDGGTE